MKLGLPFFVLAAAAIGGVYGAPGNWGRAGPASWQLPPRRVWPADPYSAAIGVADQRVCAGAVGRRTVDGSRYAQSARKRYLLRGVGHVGGKPAGSARRITSHAASGGTVGRTARIVHGVRTRQEDRHSRNHKLPHR